MPCLRWSSRKARVVARHVRQVLAIEALVAGQGLDLRAPLNPGIGVRAAHAALREHVTPLSQDRVLHHDIEVVEGLLDNGVLCAAAAAAQTAPSTVQMER